jgi:ankyrin repeat protein
MTAATRNETPEVIAALIKAGADADAKDNDGWTPLSHSARYGENPGAIAALVAAGADVNAKNEYGVTPLMLAMGRGGAAEIIALLTEAGAEADWNWTVSDVEAALGAGLDINAKDKDGAAPLMYAAAYGQNPGAVAALIEAGADVNAKDAESKTPLMYAAWRNKNPAVAAVLIGAGADIRANDENGRTPLMFAAAHNETLEAAAALIGAGADVNEYDRNGWTPLMRAARYNCNPEVIAALIKAGADLNARDYDKGWRPLTYAAYGNENLEVIVALVEAGADIRVKDAFDRTPLTLAIRHNKNPEIITYFIKTTGEDVNAKDASGMTLLTRAAMYNANPEIIAALLEAGTDVNARDNDGETPLMETLWYSDNPKVTAALIEAGADVNAHADDGETPLMRAAGYSGNPEVITALVEAGADVNARDNDGKTPLMRAVGYNDNPKIIAALIEAGADVNARDNDGETPLMRALVNSGYANSLETINTLLDAGADVNIRNGEGRRAFDYAPKDEEFMKTGAFKTIREKTALPRLEYSAQHKEYFLVFGETSGDFFGDGGEVKIEFMGDPIMESVWSETKEKRDGVDPYGDEKEDEEPGQYTEGVVYSAECVRYFLRVTAPGDTGEKYYDLTRDIPDGCDKEDFKLCDVDGDGVSEVFLFFGIDTSSVAGGITAVSFKRGEFRKLLDSEGYSYIYTEEGYQASLMGYPFLRTGAERVPTDALRGFSYPEIDAEPRHGFNVYVCAKFSNGGGEYKAETVIDYRDGSYADSVFSPEGDPIYREYEPWVDWGFRYAGVADTDGDGRDEIYGAMPVNGTCNADDIAFVNVLYKWTDDGWKLLAATITDIDSPLDGLPGITPSLKER